MRRSLLLHPDSRCDAVTRIDVDVARTGRASVVLEYCVEGTIADIRLPAPSAATRADGLWQHSCFEAFLAGPDESYFEFNFAPSTEWAAYRLDGYRSGMTPAPGMIAPVIEVRADTSNLNVRVALALDGLPDIAIDGPLRLGLSTVIEEVNGRKSYWALAHLPGKPDFHHRDCFALELPRI